MSSDLNISSPASKISGNTSRFVASATQADTIGRLAVRYGLVVVLVAIGAMKFTAYEAEAISGLVRNSPLMAWTYDLFSVRVLAILVGTTELSIAVMIAVKPWFAKLSVVGSALAIGMFLTTLSFMASTPGVVEPSIGFPALSVMPGQFLVKDVALLGIAIWTFEDSMSAASARPR